MLIAYFWSAIEIWLVLMSLAFYVAFVSCRRKQWLINHLIDALKLKPCADKKVGLCLAGNKRKITLGIVMIGDP